MKELINYSEVLTPMRELPFNGGPVQNSSHVWTHEETQMENCDGCGYFAGDRTTGDWVHGCVHSTDNRCYYRSARNQSPDEFTPEIETGKPIGKLHTLGGVFELPGNLPTNESFNETFSSDLQETNNIMPGGVYVISVNYDADTVPETQIAHVRSVLEAHKLIVRRHTLTQGQSVTSNYLVEMATDGYVMTGDELFTTVGDFTGGTLRDFDVREVSTVTTIGDSNVQFPPIVIAGFLGILLLAFFTGR